MQSVVPTGWEADLKTLMIIYRSIIRSKTDYGCIVYNSASSRELESLESVSNEAMRISSGCCANAIHLAFNAISATKGKNFSMFTDSRSCLQMLQEQIPTNPKVRKL